MNFGNIPDDVIAAVLKHHEIVEVVSKYVHLTKQGRNFKGLCPFHSEKSPSFTVSPDKQIFNCFGCGTAGNAIKFVMEIDGLSFPEAVRQLAEEADIPVSWESSSAEETAGQTEKRLIIEGHELAAKWYNYLLKNSELGKPAMEYLRGRGFTDRMIEEFQIGYSPPMWDKLCQFLSSRNINLALMEKGGLVSANSEGSGYLDRFRDRIMFPIRDARGKTIAFAGRVLKDAQPKYLNTPETVLFNKSRILYNLDQAKSSIRKSGKAVLFEGYADVIKAWDAGVAYGIATMGTALTEEHARMLKRLTDEVIVCYDGDDAGQAAAFKSLGLLEKSGCNAQVAILTGKMDPDEYISVYSAEKFNSEIIDSAVPSTKFKLIYLQRNHILQKDEGKLKYIHEALKIIAELNAPTEREHYVKELSQDFQYSIQSLNEQLHQIREQLQKKKQFGDNKNNPWNNVMNDGRTEKTSPVLLPAFHNAERKLLAVMMEDGDIAHYVREKLGDGFNVEAHAALAAYLYAYYAEGKEPDASRYMATLQNEELERVASSIAMTDSAGGINDKVIDDYIREIKKYPQFAELALKKEEIARAERAGDVIRAAQIASEIISLERQLKTL